MYNDFLSENERIFLIGIFERLIIIKKTEEYGCTIEDEHTFYYSTNLSYEQFDTFDYNQDVLARFVEETGIGECNFNVDHEEHWSLCFEIKMYDIERVFKQWGSLTDHQRAYFTDCMEKLNEFEDHYYYTESTFFFCSDGTCRFYMDYMVTGLVEFIESIESLIKAARAVLEGVDVNGVTSTLEKG